jgi:hypothetical protein
MFKISGGYFSIISPQILQIAYVGVHDHIDSKARKILFTYSIFRKNQDGMKTTTCLLEKNDVTYPSKIKKYMQFPSRDHLRASLLNPSSDTLAMCVVAWLCLAPA